MSGPSFFQTIMGRQFYDGTMPKMVKAAERIATGLERIADQGNGEPDAKVTHDAAAESMEIRIGNWSVTIERDGQGVAVNVFDCEEGSSTRYELGESGFTQKV